MCRLLGGLEAWRLTVDSMREEQIQEAGLAAEAATAAAAVVSVEETLAGA